MLRNACFIALSKWINRDCTGCRLGGTQEHTSLQSACDSSAFRSHANVQLPHLLVLAPTVHAARLPQTEPLRPWLGVQLTAFARCKVSSLGTWHYARHRHMSKLTRCTTCLSTATANASNAIPLRQFSCICCAGHCLCGFDHHTASCTACLRFSQFLQVALVHTRHSADRCLAR